MTDLQIHSGPNGVIEMIKQGAEAKLYSVKFLGKPAIVKERLPKKYRHPKLDEILSKERTKTEAKCIMRCRMNGIHTPALFWVDLVHNRIYMEYLQDSTTAKDYLIQLQSSHDSGDSIQARLAEFGRKIGHVLGKLHKGNIIHGDLTTSNILLQNPTEESPVVLIDFGLGYVDGSPEDKGVDLYVLERALLSTHPNSESLFAAVLESYSREYGKGATDVIKKLDEVRLRGRKRTMVG